MDKPEIPSVGACAVCGEQIYANEARITDADGTLYHPEHYDAGNADVAQEKRR